MKIDIGSGGYGYSSPAYYERRDGEETERSENDERRLRFSLSVSRAPLSVSLANALWTLERDRRIVPAKASEDSENDPNGGVLNKYLEFSASLPEELH